MLIDKLCESYSRVIIFTPDLGKVGQTFKDSTSALRRTDSWYDFLPQGPRTHRWGQFALAAPFRLSRKPSFAAVYRTPLRTLHLPSTGWEGRLMPVYFLLKRYRIPTLKIS